MKRELAALTAAALLTTSCGIGGPSLEDAHAECRIDGDDVSLSYNSRDDILTLRSLDRQDSHGDSDLADNARTAYECLIEVLEIPEDIQSHISETTVRDGQQGEQWRGVDATWIRKPDVGTQIDFEG